MVLERIEYENKVKEGIQSIRQAQEHLQHIDKELLSLANAHKSLSQDMMGGTKPNLEALCQMPKVLFECNLVAAINELTQQLLNQQLGITFNLIGTSVNLDYDRGTLFFKCIQEWIAFSIQQAESNHLLLELSFCADTIELYIEDNGTTLNLSERRLDMTWQKLVAKIHLLNGFVTSDPRLYVGNILTMIIPRIAKKTNG